MERSLAAVLHAGVRPGGLFEQDDTANWSSITQTLQTPTAGRLSLQYGMGLEVETPEEWPGVGTIYVKPTVGDVSERHFYGHWHERVQGAELHHGDTETRRDK